MKKLIDFMIDHIALIVIIVCIAIMFAALATSGI